MHAARALIRAMDHITNIVIGLCLLLTLLYGGYALWDSWMVYSGAAVSAELIAYQPVGENDALTFEKLRKINPDICAWISLDNTRINYPVVQGEDNDEYMDKNVYGQYALSGAIFLDQRNSPEFTDLYSILYGHHMDGGAMFGDMDLFADPAFFAENGGGKLYLPDTTYNLYVFAYIRVDAFNVQAYMMRKDSREMALLLDYLKQNAEEYKDIDVGGQVIALSTCSAVETNGRELLLATLTKEERTPE